MVYKLKKGTNSSFLKGFIIVFILSLILASLAMILIEVGINFNTANFNPEVISQNGETLCTSYGTTYCNWYAQGDISDYANSPNHLNLDPTEQTMLHSMTSTYYLPYTSNISISDSTNALLSESNTMGWLLALTNTSSGLNQSSVLCVNAFYCENYTLDSYQLYTNTSEANTFFPAERVVTATNNNDYHCIINDATNQCDDFDYYYDSATHNLLVVSSQASCLSTGYVYVPSRKANYCSFPANESLETLSVSQRTYYKFAPGENNYFQFGSFTSCGTVVECSNQHVVKASTLNASNANIFFMETSGYLYNIVHTTEIFPVEIVYQNNTMESYYQNQSFNLFFNQNAIICKLQNEASYLYNTFSCGIKQNYNVITYSNFDLAKAPSSYLNTIQLTEGNWLFIGSDGTGLEMALAHLQYGVQKDIIGLASYYFNDSSGFIKNGGFIGTFEIIIFIAILNSISSFILLKLHLWRRIAGKINKWIPLLIQGKVGSLLELTKLFDFSGDWFLESSMIEDIDFSSSRATLGQIIKDHWNDVLFFPIALAATLGFVTSTVVNSILERYGVTTQNVFNNQEANLLIILIGLFMLLMPFILSFWTPLMWIYEDSGLKIITHKDTGDSNSLKTFASEIKSGFHTVVGFGAIIGIGTSISVAFVSIFTNGDISKQYLSISVGSLLNNYSPLINLILCTVIFILVAVALTINGMYLMSHSYINNDHFKLVKKFRTELSAKGFVKATVPKFVTAETADIFYENGIEM